MKRIPYITVLGCIIIAVLISVCGEKDIKNNLIIGNKSSEIISNIAIQRIGKTEIMGSNLKQNQHCYFDMGVQKNCTYKVEFEDKNNKSTLSNEFTCDFNKEGIVDINVRKDNNGKWAVVLN